MLRRITRLWIVLIPALLLTLGLDTAGQIMGGRLGYDGSFYQFINSGPNPASPANLSIRTLVANIFFLQTILAPVLGSNGPLWSLANEFWYYIMFPLIFVGVFGNSSVTSRFVMGIVGISLAFLLPFEIVLLGLIWVGGAVASWALRRDDRRGIQFGAVAIVWLVLSIMAAAAAIVVNKRWPGVWSDLCLGGAFACMLPSLTLLPRFGTVYDSVAGSLAKISYTLYATHFPVLAFIWFVLLAPHKWTIGPTAALVMGCMIATAFVVATAMWWLFERNTDRLRNLAESWLLVRAQT